MALRRPMKVCVRQQGGLDSHVDGHQLTETLTAIELDRK